MNHAQLLWNPFSLIETLDMGNVSTQRSVDRTTVRTNQDSSVDTRPTWVVAATICTDGERMSGLGFAEHDDDMFLTLSVKHNLVI